MLTPNRDAFLALKAVPGCDHPPQVRLLTTGNKACIQCAFHYLETLEGVVAYFDITDGPLNDKAQAYGLRRNEHPKPAEIQTSIESGDRKSY